MSTISLWGLGLGGAVTAVTRRSDVFRNKSDSCPNGPRQFATENNEEREEMQQADAPSSGQR